MPFTKGHNTGRPKGSKNKDTELKNILRDLSTAYSFQELKSDLDQLSPRSRLVILKDIWKFVEPTLKQVEKTGDTQSEADMEYLEKLMAIPEENFDKLHG
tara:strand:+ start:95 stop:394 length:300 start_codon:yes stop_codon:yes gene_type:complete